MFELKIISMSFEKNDGNNLDTILFSKLTLEIKRIEWYVFFMYIWQQYKYGKQNGRFCLLPLSSEENLGHMLNLC